VGYSWTGWSLSGLRGIEPFEVLQVLYAERRWPQRAHGPSGTTVLTIWARTRSGRPLIVAVRRVGEREWLIVGARDMYASERVDFVRWEEAQDG
jgi:hypothetical protein